MTVFERAPRAGGILRYGIPDFKLEKWVVDRRVELMQAEGIDFEAMSMRARTCLIGICGAASTRFCWQAVRVNRAICPFPAGA